MKKILSIGLLIASPSFMHGAESKSKTARTLKDFSPTNYTLEKTTDKWGSELLIALKNISEDLPVQNAVTAFYQSDLVKDKKPSEILENEDIKKIATKFYHKITSNKRLQTSFKYAYKSSELGESLEKRIRTWTVFRAHYFFAVDKISRAFGLWSPQSKKDHEGGLKLYLKKNSSLDLKELKKQQKLAALTVLNYWASGITRSIDPDAYNPYALLPKED